MYENEYGQRDERQSEKKKNNTSVRKKNQQAVMDWIHLDRDVQTRYFAVWYVVMYFNKHNLENDFVVGCGLFSAC